ncbi:gamma-glutamylcyclotransferase family protein [Spirosoma arcticum]
MTENPDYLLVYGTLRPDFDNPFAEFVRQHSQYVGEATFPGLLFSLAWSDASGYPGAVYQPDSLMLVVGTVYDVSRQKQLILTHLDDYEGVGDAFDQPNEYERAVIPVRCSGITIDCWIYLYNWPTNGKPVITSGDYVRYSRNE